MSCESIYNRLKEILLELVNEEDSYFLILEEMLPETPEGVPALVLSHAPGSEESLDSWSNQFNYNYTIHILLSIQNKEEMAKALDIVLAKFNEKENADTLNGASVKLNIEWAPFITTEDSLIGWQIGVAASDLSFFT